MAQTRPPQILTAIQPQATAELRLLGNSGPLNGRLSLFLAEAQDLRWPVDLMGLRRQAAAWLAPQWGQEALTSRGNGLKRTSCSLALPAEAMQHWAI